MAVINAMPKSTKRPAFFKVFLEQFSSQLMEIPGDFCNKNLINRKWKVGHLTGPSGNTWKMDVIERPDYEGLFLGGAGWKTFLKDHSIRTGHFLVFKFDDGDEILKKMDGMLLLQHNIDDRSWFDLHLKVKIYDQTRCEKKSAFAAKPFQTTCTDLIIKVKEEEDEQQVEAVYVQPISTQHPPNHHHLPQICWYAGGEPSSAAANRPFFIGRIKHRGYYSIDEEFKREYLSEYSNSTVLILSFGDKKKEWSVTAEMDRKGQCLNISKGWTKFSHDNHLRIGVRLRFEMVGDFQFVVSKI